MFKTAFLIALLLSFQAKAIDSFAPIVNKVMPTVVNISTQMAEPEDSPDVENSLIFINNGHVSLGSGFIADEDGYILTNKHVIEKAKEIKVTTFDGKIYTAEIKGEDGISDVALIKIEPEEKLPYALFADSSLTQVGDWVVAIGNPFGLANSVTTGIVSAKSRDIGETPFDDYIQTDAPINPGNSGGPMFNLQGEVVGLNTLIFSKQGNSLGVGFAIPSNQLKPIYEALKENGTVERSFIGAALKETMYQEKPALIVTEIKDEEINQKNELEVGDLIVGFEGKPIISKKAFETEVLWYKPGSEVILNIIRNDEEIEKSAELVAIKTDFKPTVNRFADTQTKLLNGVYYEKLGIFLNNHQILKVDPKSEAAAKGMKAGDEILSINGQTFPNMEDFKLYVGEFLSRDEMLHFDLKDADGEHYFIDLMGEDKN